MLRLCLKYFEQTIEIKISIDFKYHLCDSIHVFPLTGEMKEKKNDIAREFLTWTYTLSKRHH